MPIGGAIAGVGSVASGAMAASAQSKAAKKAANATTQAADQANATQLAIYNDQRNLLEPAAIGGAQARARQMLMEGFTPDEVKAYLTSTYRSFANNSTAAPNYGGGTPVISSDFSVIDGRHGGADHLTEGQYDLPSLISDAGGVTGHLPDGAPDVSWVDGWQWQPNSPSYDFRFNEGQRALDRSAAARGRLFSGATGRAQTRYGQDFASQEFENDYRRLGGLAGDGTDATNTVVNVAGGYGDAVSANQMTAGAARASAYNRQGAAWGDFWGNTVPGAIGAGYGYGKGAGWWG